MPEIEHPKIIRLYRPDSFPDESDYVHETPEETFQEDWEQIDIMTNRPIGTTLWRKAQQGNTVAKNIIRQQSPSASASSESE